MYSIDEIEIRTNILLIDRFCSEQNHFTLFDVIKNTSNEIVNRWKLLRDLLDQKKIFLESRLNHLIKLKNPKAVSNSYFKEN